MTGVIFSDDGLQFIVELYVIKQYLRFVSRQNSKFSSWEEMGKEWKSPLLHKYIFIGNNEHNSAHSSLWKNQVKIHEDTMHVYSQTISNLANIQKQPVMTINCSLIQT